VNVVCCLTRKIRWRFQRQRDAPLIKVYPMVAASVHSNSRSSDALPVCLRVENLNRLVSLWDVVNEFKAVELCRILGNFGFFRCAFGGVALNQSDEWERCAVEFIAEVEDARKLCESAGLEYAVSLLMRTQDNLRGSKREIAAFLTETTHAVGILFDELNKRRFLHVLPDRIKYLDQPNLFGIEVNDAFPSAVQDIREAGNCFAADCNTAAVFHLMRAVEWGLRALCVAMGFRRLRTRNKKTGKVKYVPLGWTDWETTLNQLKERVTQLVGKTKRGAKKQVYQEFYYPALQDIEAIKDAWRNHVMHTRREYGPKDADAVFSHVRRLMVKLAERVSEC
jgi:hypothetical protein